MKLAKVMILYDERLKRLEKKDVFIFSCDPRDIEKYEHMDNVTLIYFDLGDCNAKVV